MKVKSKNGKGAEKGEKIPSYYEGRDESPIRGGMLHSDVRVKHWGIPRSVETPTSRSPFSLYSH